MLRLERVRGRLGRESLVFVLHLAYLGNGRLWRERRLVLLQIVDIYLFVPHSTPTGSQAE